MSAIDTFKTRKILKIDSQKYIFYDLSALENTFKLDFSFVPLTLKILLENLLRYEDGITVTSEIIASGSVIMDIFYENKISKIEN